jgi:Glycosyl transferase family 2
MRLVMAMKVRDEIDVVEHTLRYHLARGADQWIVTDNGSTDGTLEVLRRYEAAGLLKLIEEPGEDFRTEAHWWVTRMARLAATEMSADWVAHVDADEFWWPARGSLKETLAAIPDEYGVVLAPRPEFPARPGYGEWWERMTVREVRSRLRPKIAHRAEPDVVLHRGAHDVDFEHEAGSKHAGRAVMRAVKEDADEADDGRLVWAPVFPARVMHFPIRSFEQYKRRVETTIFHGGFEDRAHGDLRQAYDEGRLPELYERLIIDDEEVTRGIRERRLVRDTRIRDFLEACPDPLGSDPVGAEQPLREGTAAEQEAELDEIRHDAMQSLARTQRSLIRQLDNFRERVAKQRKRLRKAEGGRLRNLVRRGS